MVMSIKQLFFAFDHSLSAAVAKRRAKIKKNGQLLVRSHFFRSLRLFFSFFSKKLLNIDRFKSLFPVDYTRFSEFLSSS